MLAKHETLEQYEQAANHLLAVSEKPVLIAAMRVLAGYVGHYQLRYGPIGATAWAGINSPVSSAAEVADRIEALRVLASALTLAALPTPDERPD